MYYKTLKVFLVACSRTDHDDRLFGGDRSKLWCSLKIIDSKTWVLGTAPWWGNVG